MNSSYNHKEHSKNWTDVYKEKKYYLPNYKLPYAYCITIPPPNITGRLHMGHAFQCTLMDILIRYYKMCGYNTLWKFGTDHAGIATQILLEQRFNSKDIDLLKVKANSWKFEAISNIKDQMKNLGFFINWNTPRFTLDNHFSYAVKHAFIKLYKDNFIYRDTKLVNWDMSLKTAISDLETVYKSVVSKLYYIKYYIKESSEFLVIATTRPETIFADVAIAINPNDSRYSKYKGLKVLVPFSNREIPVIFDSNVDIKFGTGCLKVTPAHDFKDFEMGQIHKLPIINIFTDDGFLNHNAPVGYQGLSINIARKKVIVELQKAEKIVNVLEYNGTVPIGDRTGNVIEPFLTAQWYLNVKGLLEPVYNALHSDKIKITPVKWKKVFLNWLDNMKDWCISRQIWWGHQIPIWYDDNNNHYVGNNIKDIITSYNLPIDINLRQDKDVLDTWFSSALWPFASLGWPSNKIEFMKFYPTNMLVTGFDIIFFWVIRMIMFGIYFTGTVPFKEIYVHGLIRDSKGSKMSKTKGNVIDPLDVVYGISNMDLKTKYTNNLMNIKMKKTIMQNIDLNYPNGIESYGVDSLRLCLASMSTDNNSLKMDLRNVEKYKHFCNKLWNAGKFLKQFSYLPNKIIRRSFYDKYILIYWNEIKSIIINCIEQRFFSRAVDYIYNFFWSEFCDWFIELSKTFRLSKKYYYFNNKNITLVFKEFLIILSPFAPIITEEIWCKNYNNDSELINEKYPSVSNVSFVSIDHDVTVKFKQLVIFIRKNNCLKNNDKVLFIFIVNITSCRFLEKVLGFICERLKIIKVKLVYFDTTIIDEIKFNFDDIVFISKKNNVSNVNIRSNNSILVKIDRLKKLLNDVDFKRKAPLSIVHAKELELTLLLNELDKLSDN